MHSPERSCIYFSTRVFMCVLYWEKLCALQRCVRVYASVHSSERGAYHSSWIILCVRVCMHVCTYRGGTVSTSVRVHLPGRSCVHRSSWVILWGWRIRWFSSWFLLTDPGLWHPGRLSPWLCRPRVINLWQRIKWNSSAYIVSLPKVPIILLFNFGGKWVHINTRYKFG